MCVTAVVAVAPCPVLRGRRTGDDIARADFLLRLAHIGAQFFPAIALCEEALAKRLCDETAVGFLRHLETSSFMAE